MNASAARIEVLRDPTRPVVLVRLFGEFDTHDLKALRVALDGAVATRSETSVDLSRVAFMDARCSRELAVRSWADRDRLSLRNPSWQARASLRACGFTERPELRFAEEAHVTREAVEARGTTRNGRASLAGVA